MGLKSGHFLLSLIGDGLALQTRIATQTRAPKTGEVIKIKTNKTWKAIHTRNTSQTKQEKSSTSRLTRPGRLSTPGTLPKPRAPKTGAAIKIKTNKTWKAIHTRNSSQTGKFTLPGNLKLMTTQFNDRTEVDTT